MEISKTPVCIFDSGRDISDAARSLARLLATVNLSRGRDRTTAGGKKREKENRLFVIDASNSKPLSMRFWSLLLIR